MAFDPKAAKGSVLTFYQGSGSTTAVSTSFNDINFARAVATINVTTFGDNDEEYLPALKNSNLSFSGLFDNTTIQNLEALMGASTNPTFQYSPASTAAGSIFWKFDTVVTNVTVGGSVSGEIKASVTAQGTGAVTSTNH